MTRDIMVAKASKVSCMSLGLATFTGYKAIPAKKVGQRGYKLVSLYDLVTFSGKIESIGGPPLLRLSVLRLLLAVESLARHGGAHSALARHDAFRSIAGGMFPPLYGPTANPDGFRPGALQIENSTCKDVFSIDKILGLEPTEIEADRFARDLQGLLIAYFSPTFGLGERPLHVWNISAFATASTLDGFMIKNGLPGVSNYLTHRWRNIEIIKPGQMTVGPPDQTYTGAIEVDPWGLSYFESEEAIKEVTLSLGSGSAAKAIVPEHRSLELFGVRDDGFCWSKEIEGGKPWA